MLVCYIETTPKIRINDLSRAYATGAGYYEVIREVGNIISIQPLYNQTFDNLIFEFVKGNNWTFKHLAEALNIDEKTLYRHRYGEINNREMTINICIALGLDLVSTIIVLMSKGYILNPINSIDKKIMTFVNTNKETGLQRMISYEDYMK